MRAHFFINEPSLMKKRCSADKLMLKQKNINAAALVIQNPRTLVLEEVEECSHTLDCRFLAILDFNHKLDFRLARTAQVHN